jgi:uncharacterized SAM-dependent methyltransferase
MATTPIEIIDVRVRSDASESVSDARADVLAGLAKPVGAKTLPTVLLYDERGLRIYDEITTDADEYYLFGAEEALLKERAPEMVRIMNARADSGALDAVVLELGAG